MLPPRVESVALAGRLADLASEVREELALAVPAATPEATFYAMRRAVELLDRARVELERRRG